MAKKDEILDITKDDEKEALAEKIKALEEKEKALAEKEKELEEKKQVNTVNAETVENEIALTTGEILAKQQKFPVRLPLSEVNPEINDVPVPVTINGYTYLIKRGEMTQVPESVYTILLESNYI